MTNEESWAGGEGAAVGGAGVRGSVSGSVGGEETAVTGEGGRERLSGTGVRGAARGERVEGRVGDEEIPGAASGGRSRGRMTGGRPQGRVSSAGARGEAAGGERVEGPAADVEAHGDEAAGTGEKARGRVSGATVRGPVSGEKAHGTAGNGESAQGTARGEKVQDSVSGGRARGRTGGQAAWGSGHGEEVQGAVVTSGPAQEAVSGEEVRGSGSAGVSRDAESSGAVQETGGPGAGSCGAGQDTAPQGSLRLDDQLCFALYAAQRAVTAAYRPLLEELGLTYTQYLVLLTLWEQGETTVKHLSSTLHLDYGTMSPLLKRMEGAGLIHRTRSAHDERSVLVSCTGQGEELRGRAARVPGALLSATGLDEAEVERLRAELWGVTERAEGAAERAR